MTRRTIRAVLGCILTFAVSAANAQVSVLKVSSPTNNDANLHWMQTFESMVEDRSGGRIDVELYPAGQLGQIPATIEGVTFGTIEITMPASGFFIGLDPRFEIFDVPGLFADLAQAQRTLADPELVSHYSEYGSDSGVRTIGVYAFAPMGLVSRDPVESLTSLDGQKLRVAGPALLQSRPFQAFGASPVSMPLGETLPALQTGAIDGLLAGMPVFTTFKFYDIAQNLTILPETYLIVAIVANQGYLDGLGSELAEIVTTAAQDATAEVNGWNTAEIERQMRDWTDNGGRLLTLSDADRRQWLETVQASLPDAIAANSALEAELDAFRTAAERHAAD